MSNLLTYLRTALGDPRATFRRGQEDAIRAVLNPPHRALVVQATGWGKSMVYFVATKVLREQGRGPTLVISPLLSLMRNQEEAANRLGLTARQWNNENESVWPKIERELAANLVDLLLVSPERLSNDLFINALQSTSLQNTGLLVVDEAHCISDWGHDFRPDYQLIGRFLRNMPPSTSVLATTATANNRVVKDIATQIGTKMEILRGPLARSGLKIQVLRAMSAAERLAWLSDHLDELPRSGIIYVLTQRDADRVTRWLNSRGHNVKAYHAGVAPNNDHGQLRRTLESELQRNKVKALVATVALGMGFDKPDLGFVVHFQSPGNLVAYYQQIGRAGRAIPEALAILMLGAEDDQIIEWFITHARPKESEIQALLAALSDRPARQNELLTRVDMTKKTLQGVLKCLLAMEPSPITKVDKTYQLAPVEYAPDIARITELQTIRLHERERLVKFAQSDSCFMELVQTELDDPNATACGECANCRSLDLVSRNISTETLESALKFIDRSEHEIQPRKQWAYGAFPLYGWAGNIALNSRCAVGWCLSYYAEPGLGNLVMKGKATGHYDDKVVARAAQVIKGRSLGPFDSIAIVPSSGSNQAMVNFAERLSAVLGVPFNDVVRAVRKTPAQKAQNSAFNKANNLDGKFDVHNEVDGRILLLDDMVDSKWTFTVIGALLRQKGASEVVPLALANTAGHDDDE